jgi:hypothetical protein
MELKFLYREHEAYTKISDKSYFRIYYDKKGVRFRFSDKGIELMKMKTGDKLLFGIDESTKNLYIMPKVNHSMACALKHDAKGGYRFVAKNIGFDILNLLGIKEKKKTLTFEIMPNLIEGKYFKCQLM